MTGYIKPKRVLGCLAVMLILSMCFAVSSYARLRRRYHGIDLDLPKKRCSMEIRGADVADVLRTFADQYNLNFVLSSDVSGKIDLILKKVPVDQAFLTILRTAKLAYIKEGKIYRIMSLEKMAEENKLREESIQMETRIFRPNYASATRLAGSMKNILSKRDGAFVDADQRTNAIVVKDISQKLDEMEALYHLLDVEKVTAVRPVKTEVIKLKFIDSKEMGKNIKSLLSKAGRVEINTKTNSLIISDLPENLAQIETLIEDIDKPSRQVLIEARIVETTKNFRKALGIQWGGRYTDGPPSGKLFPKTTITGIAGAATENFAVNLPISEANPYGGIGISLGHLKDKILLDIQLTAMEDKGEGRVLSAPRIATLDNTKALIEIGTRIPYLVRDEDEQYADDYDLEYVDAFTRLNVTPHITSDNRIKMKIVADKDSPDFSRAEVLGHPWISRKGAETELIVKDGETTVIGGFSITNTSESQSAVPWFADLPLIGVLFKNKSRSKNYDELLIFITPHIIEN
jgi:type IV pilus secretin PilQ/predicted competence protein